MGLLDDAIREHLELKRRHGADPDEVERQEHEALGPPQRGEEPEAGRPDEVGAVAAGEPATGEMPVAAYQAEETADEPLAPEDFAADAPTTAYVPPDVEQPDEVEPPAGEEEVPSAGHEADAPGYDEDPWLDEDEERRPPEPQQHQPPEDSGEEDVLEETPDFLQETPEHDRLWFEQKPPRDFDWDR
jgi:hypothetical protein